MNGNEVFFGDPVSALRFEGATGDPYELTLKQLLIQQVVIKL